MVKVEARLLYAYNLPKENKFWKDRGSKESIRLFDKSSSISLELDEKTAPEMLLIWLLLKYLRKKQNFQSGQEDDQTNWGAVFANEKKEI